MRTFCNKCSENNCAENVPIFKGLNSNELEELVKKIDSKEYKKNEVVFLEGTKAQTLYFVNKGKIKLYKYTKDGKEQILHILSEGDFFGELNLLRESEYGFSAKVIETSNICTLGNNDLKELLLNNPQIAIKILEVIGERLSKVESLAQNLATKDVLTRFAYLLLDLAEKYGRIDGQNINIDLPISREEMANCIGVTRETISRKLKIFEDERIIKIVGRKRIIIINKGKMENYI